MSNEERIEFSYEPETSGPIWREVIFPTLNWHWENVIRTDEFRIEDIALCDTPTSQATEQKPAAAAERTTAPSSKEYLIGTKIGNLPIAPLEGKHTDETIKEFQSLAGHAFGTKPPETAGLPEVYKAETSEMDARAADIPEALLHDDKETESTKWHQDLHLENVSLEGPEFPKEFKIEILAAESDEAATSQATAPVIEKTEVQSCEPLNEGEEKPWITIADEILKAAFEEIKDDEKLQMVNKDIPKVFVQEHFEEMYEEVASSAQGPELSGGQEVKENALESGTVIGSEDAVLENNENDEPVANARDLMEAILQEHEEARRRAIGIPETQTLSSACTPDITTSRLQQETEEFCNIPASLTPEEQMGKGEIQINHGSSNGEPAVDISPNSEEVVRISSQNLAKTELHNATTELAHQKSEEEVGLDASDSLSQAVAQLVNEILQNLDGKHGALASEEYAKRFGRITEEPETALNAGVFPGKPALTADKTSQLMMEKNDESPGTLSKQNIKEDETSNEQLTHDQNVPSEVQEPSPAAVAFSEQKTPTAAIENLLNEMEKLHDEAEMLKKESVHEERFPPQESGNISPEIAHSHIRNEEEPFMSQSSTPNFNDEVSGKVNLAEDHKTSTLGAQEGTSSFSSTKEKEVLQLASNEIQNDANGEEATLAVPSETVAPNVPVEDDDYIRKTFESEETTKTEPSSDEQILHISQSDEVVNGSEGSKPPDHENIEASTESASVKVQKPSETFLPEEKKISSFSLADIIKPRDAETALHGIEEKDKVKEEAKETISAIPAETKILEQPVYDEKTFTPSAKKEESILKPKAVQEEHSSLQLPVDESVNEEKLEPSMTNTRPSETVSEAVKMKIAPQCAVKVDEKAPVAEVVTLLPVADQEAANVIPRVHQPPETEAKTIPNRNETRKECGQDMAAGPALVSVPKRPEGLQQGEKSGDSSFQPEDRGTGNDKETGDKKEFLEKMIAENQALFSRLSKSPEYFSSETNTFPSPRDMYGSAEATLTEVAEFYGAGASLPKPDEAVRKLSDEDMPPGFFDVRCEDTGIIIDESRPFYKRPQKRGRGHFRAPFFDYEQAEEAPEQQDSESLHSDNKQKPRRRPRRGGRKF